MPSRLSHFCRCAALPLLVAACGPATAPTAPVDANVLAQSDFENTIGWGSEQPTLSTAKAHSGHTAVVVTPETPFGYTFARTLDELAPGALPRQMELTAWVLRVSSGSTSSIVVQVDASKTDEARVYYVALPLAQSVATFGEWAAVKLPIALPANVAGPNKLKIYLWNGLATAPTYLDDVVLRRVAAGK